MENRILTVDPSDLYEMLSLTEHEVETLRRLCRSEDDADKVLFLEWVGVYSLGGKYGPLFVPLLEELAPHEVEDIGHRALMYLGDYTEWEPTLVWEVMLRLMDNDDLFPLLSAFILEVLLSYHAEEYLARVRERIVSGDRQWWLLLRGCYFMRQMEGREDEVIALLAEYEQEQ
ncbi:MAG: hypothetical protein R6V07_05940 [Armatimonadota bacterium]